ncbi:hypothetical protein BDW22DRAFT_647715 [Trametopsis cervina]|nr:hypothetical protein BDW22DRAFT_647715 [Trametopsis cervina]
MDAADGLRYEQVRALTHDASVLLVDGRCVCRTHAAAIRGQDELPADLTSRRCLRLPCRHANGSDASRACRNLHALRQARRGAVRRQPGRSNRGTRRGDIHTGGSGVRGATDDGPTRTDTGQAALERRIGSRIRQVGTGNDAH